MNSRIQEEGSFNLNGAMAIPSCQERYREVKRVLAEMWGKDPDNLSAAELQDIDNIALYGYTFPGEDSKNWLSAKLGHQAAIAYSQKPSGLR